MSPMCELHPKSQDQRLALFFEFPAFHRIAKVCQTLPDNSLHLSPPLLVGYLDVLMLRSYGMVMTVCTLVTMGGTLVMVTDTPLEKMVCMFPSVKTGDRSTANTGGMENNAMTAIIPLVKLDCMNGCVMVQERRF